MRLIDADAMCADLATVDPRYKAMIEWGVRVTEAQPTVDAVEVVRCKDCKFHLNSNEKCGLVDTRLHFYETDKVWTEDCFCAWGERREDGKTD